MAIEAVGAAEAAAISRLCRQQPARTLAEGVEHDRETHAQPYENDDRPRGPARLVTGVPRSSGTRQGRASPRRTRRDSVLATHPARKSIERSREAERLPEPAGICAQQ